MTQGRANAPLALALALLSGPGAFAQGMQPSAPGGAPNLAAQLCASCHGPGLMGGRAPSLADDTWTFGGDDASIAASIRDGRANGAMPAFKASLSESQILALVTYIREQAAEARLGSARPRGPAPGDVVRSERHSFRIELVADGLDTPWGIDVLPDGRLVVRTAGTLALRHSRPAPAGARRGPSQGLGPPRRRPHGRGPPS